MGQFTLGAYRYGLGKAWAKQQVEISFDAQTQEFVCCSDDGQRTQLLQAKGPTKTDLMGELDMAQFPNYHSMFAQISEQIIDAVWTLFAESKTAGSHRPRHAAVR